MAFNIPKSYLIEEYINKKRSSEKIAIDCDCTATTILVKLKKYNIPIRKQVKQPPKLSKKELTDLYIVQNKTGRQIAKEYSLREATVSLLLKQYGLRKTISKTYLNKRYGRLLVIEILKDTYHSHKLVRCKCDCGKIIKLPTYRLATKNTSSCGCLAYDSKCGKNNKNWRGYQDISLTYFNRLRKGAEERNLTFSISIEEIWNLYLLQNKKCAMTGLDLSFARKRNYINTQTASLDRIDSNIGYVLDNIQWVHKDINIMKKNLDNNIFIEYCKLIAKNLK